MISVQGNCPMGCGNTLFVGEGGFITCSYISCPEPDAVATLLQDRETEHVLELGEDSFTIRHPLRERLRDELMACTLHQYLTDLPGPPRLLGRYRASFRGGQWLFIAA
jgi:hypothetical protein